MSLGAPSEGGLLDGGSPDFAVHVPDNRPHDDRRRKDGVWIAGFLRPEYPGQGVGLTIKRPRSVGDLELEASKEKGPASLPEIESPGLPQVLEILVVTGHGKLVLVHGKRWNSHFERLR